MSARILTILVALVPLPAWAQTGQADVTAALVAQGFVIALLEGDLPTAASLAAPPFSFDGAVAPDAGALRAELERLVSSGRFRGRRVLRVQTFSAQDAVRRFGEPPGRVRDLAGRRDLVALVRLNRGGVVLFLRKVATFWRVVGVTD
ncbi:MAG: hypothetical protein HYY06_10360 [Deltaproteobacteria bacterium]|nr:hypothetical protein [Deltaproteobacteria bacterium]